MRLVIDLYRTDDGVEGIVAVEGASKPQRFSGWLDLLRVLEGLEGLEPPDTKGQV